MSNGTLPSYLSMAKPNPAENRAPWYKSTAPAYAGIFLWVVFYMEIPTFLKGMGPGGVGLSILALIVAGLVCHFLFYLVPGLFGMKTGYPLYVIGSSTYGTQGGFLMPGLLMGILQFGWLAVNAAVATSFILLAFGADPTPGTAAFIIIVILWTLAAVIMGVFGIKYIAKISTFLPLVPLLMLIIGVLLTIGGLGSYKAPELAPEAGKLMPFLGLIGMVVGFFATAGAAGVDFGMGNRDAKDIQLGGLTGIALATIITGVFSVLIVAGSHGKWPEKLTLEKVYTPEALLEAPAEVLTGLSAAELNAIDPEKLAAKTPEQIKSLTAAEVSAMIVRGEDGEVKPLTDKEKAKNFKLDSAISFGIGSFLAAAMFILFAIASFAPACFCTFIAANSVGTMFPKVPKMSSALAGAIVSIILAASGYALNLIGVFNIIGASFGPICGSMAADYLLSGGKWAGPRKGINRAGYIAWGVGFVVAILPMIKPATFGFITPAPVIAFVIGFVLYYVLAKAGLEPPVVELTAAPAEAAPKEAPSEEKAPEEKKE